MTDIQFSILEARLSEAGIKRAGLYADLLDHYYCLTESYMVQGLTFEESCQLAILEMAPDGFSSIEKDLDFLLTFNFQVNMKRLLYSGGLIATVGQTLYVLFRQQHWAGAPFFLMVACVALFLMVIPALIVEYAQKSKSISGNVRLRILSGLVGIALFGAGSAFKLAHWPGASIQIVVGTAILALLFFPLYFWQQYQKSIMTSA